VPVTGSPESATETTARNKERSGAMLYASAIPVTVCSMVLE
jgi:hypothetical protein